MCNGPCGSCTCAPARRLKLYEGQDVTETDIRATAARPINPTLAVQIIDETGPEVGKNPYNHMGVR